MTTPDVHRELIERDPPMSGPDIANLNRANRARLAARGLDDDVAVPSHDKFTHAAAIVCAESGYWLGLRSDTYLAKKNGKLVCSKGMQDTIRNPDHRNADQLHRAQERRAALDEGPRYYKELLKKDGTLGKGVEAAHAWAIRHIGIKESPLGSNWGSAIEPLIRGAGYNGPVPWCGCFVNGALMAAGLPSGASWGIGYTPGIRIHAMRGIDGWKWVGSASGHRGCLALFDVPGGDPTEHVAWVEDKISPTVYRTIEGNTSNGLSGSQAEGNGAFRRERSTQMSNFRLIGFAVPPY